MMVSRCSPAPSTTSMMSSKAYSVVRSLMRTQRVLPVQSSVFSASTIFLRASRFWLGATASSRSRKTWSAFDSRGLLHHLLAEPGVESWTRRARRGRSVMVFSSGDDLAGAQAGDVAPRCSRWTSEYSSVCSPSSGARWRTLAGRLGHLDRRRRRSATSWSRPGCGTQASMSRAAKCGSATMSRTLYDRRERHLAAEMRQQLLLGALAA